MCQCGSLGKCQAGVIGNHINIISLAYAFETGYILHQPFHFFFGIFVDGFFQTGLGGLFSVDTTGLYHDRTGRLVSRHTKHRPVTIQRTGMCGIGFLGKDEGFVDHTFGTFTSLSSCISTGVRRLRLAKVNTDSFYQRTFLARYRF